MDEVEKMQEEVFGRPINKLELAKVIFSKINRKKIKLDNEQFTAKELHGYEKILTDEYKDVLESMWKGMNQILTKKFDDKSFD